MPATWSQSCNHEAQAELAVGLHLARIKFLKEGPVCLCGDSASNGSIGLRAAQRYLAANPDHEAETGVERLAGTSMASLQAKLLSLLGLPTFAAEILDDD